jgi:hypothetical protein
LGKCIVLKKKTEKRLNELTIKLKSYEKDHKILEEKKKIIENEKRNSKNALNQLEERYAQDKNAHSILKQKGEYIIQLLMKEDAVVEDNETWEEYETDCGEKYYFNVKTKKTQWNKPQLASPSSSAIEETVKMAQQWEHPNRVENDFVQQFYMSGGDEIKYKCLLCIHTNTTNGKSGVGIAHYDRSNNCRTKTFDVTESVNQTDFDHLAKLGLIDAAASRVRFIHNCVLPAIEKYHGMVVAGGNGGNMVGPGGCHVLHVLFTSLQLAQCASNMVRQLVNTTNVLPLRKRVGGEIIISSLRQRLGGISLSIQDHLCYWNVNHLSSIVFGRHQTVNKTTMMVKTISKKVKNNSTRMRMSTKITPILLALPTKKKDTKKTLNVKKIQGKKFNRHTLFTVMGHDDHHLIQNLNTIGMELERCSEKDNIQRLRYHIGNKYVVTNYKLLIIALKWTNEKKEETNYSTSSWHSQIPQSIYLTKHNDHCIPAWICLSIFSKIYKVARFHCETDVYSMPYLDKQLGNPVICCASQDVKVLEQLENDIRSRWNHEILFDAEPKVLRNFLRDHAAKYSIEASIVRKSSPMILTCNNTSEKESNEDKNIIMLGSAMEEEIDKRMRVLMQ